MSGKLKPNLFSNQRFAMPESERFLNVDAVSNALDYLETATAFLERPDDFKWKWIGISVYHALYAFAVLALEKGNPDWVLKSFGRDRDNDDGKFCKRGQDTRWYKSQIELFGSGPAYRIVWAPTDNEPPHSPVSQDDIAWINGKLIGFWTAIARIQDERSVVSDILSKPVVISDNELRAIQWLTLEVRNEFIHFVPKFWGISIEGIQCGCLAALKVIDSLVFESNTIWMVDIDGQIRIRNNLDRLRNGLQKTPKL